MARLRREKIMAQMSEMQRHFINENKELFQQSLEELDASASTSAEHRYLSMLVVIHLYSSSKHNSLSVDNEVRLAPFF